MRSNQPAFDRIIQEIKGYTVIKAPIGIISKATLVKVP